MISFCTTCMNRTCHLARTLPINLVNTRDCDVEFVVLNYGSRDDLDHFMGMFYHLIMTSRVRYFKTQQDVFRMSHAKNVVHKLGDGDILCNLDADCIIDENFVKEVKERVLGSVVRGWYGGLIAIEKKNFMELRGYDERFRGWGREDDDFVNRAGRLGLEFVRLNRDVYKQIKHKPDDSNLDMKAEESIPLNSELMHNNTKLGIITVNQVSFGECMIESGKVELTKPNSMVRRAVSRFSK